MNNKVFPGLPENLLPWQTFLEENVNTYLSLRGVSRKHKIAAM
jgi:hypothetical protein